MKDRFANLTALTRGAAVISLTLGTAAGAAGCTKTDPPPAPAGSIEADPAGAGQGDGGLHVPRRFPRPNALHPRVLSGDDAGPSDGGANDGS